MKKFSFSLDKVLEIKEIEENLIQKDILILRNQMHAQEQKIQGMCEKISDEQRKRDDMNSQKSTSTEVMLILHYIESLIQQKCLYEIELKSMKQKEDELHERLIEKSREKKALERLKEIRYEDYKKEYHKFEQNSMDEISIQAHRSK